MITYIRDVFMLRHLDDALSTTLSSMLFFNVVNIMTSLSQDSSFLDRLFAKLQLASCVNPTQDTYGGITFTMNADTDGFVRLDLFKFVQEMVNLSKSIQIRNEFFAKLSQRGLVSHLARCLNEWRSGSHDPSSFGHKIALMIVDVLHMFVQSVLAHVYCDLLTHVLQFRCPRSTPDSCFDAGRGSQVIRMGRP